MRFSRGEFSHSDSFFIMYIWFYDNKESISGVLIGFHDQQQ